jgi:hypothetical protein
VAHVVEGTVRKAGNRIRVTAQLISARDGGHVWSKRYDRELANRQRSTPSLPAYESILSVHHHKFSNADFARSLSCLALPSASRSIT